MADKDKDNPLRSVSDALGSWARRVGELVADVSESVTVPEEIREHLAAARNARVHGDLGAAWVRLESAAAAPGRHLPVARGLATTLAIEVLGGSFDPEREGLARSYVGGFEDAKMEVALIDAVAALANTQPRESLDAVRRARRAMGRLSADERAELSFVLHWLAAQANHDRAFRERSLREVEKARAHLPTDAGAHIRRRIARLGADALAGEGRLDDAEGWVRDSLSLGKGADVELDGFARSLLAPLAAARGDRPAYEAIVGNGEDLSLEARARAAVALRDDTAAEAARQWLEQAPDDPARQRVVALANLRGEATSDDAVAALLRAHDAAPQAARRAHLQELCFVALWRNSLDSRVLDRALEAAKEEHAAEPELSILVARSRLSKGDPAADAFTSGASVVVREAAELEAPLGPDPISPLRDQALRARVLGGQRHFAVAEHHRLSGRRAAAEDALVSALAENPEQSAARDALSTMAHPDVGGRLEDWLGVATDALAAVPSQVLGIPLDEVALALRGVISARERLARPLSIAIMGEFSAGKSTFVNALLGQTVAPMGVLPTTQTINVFRGGHRGGARVHYRDASLATLEPAEVEAFLHSLDDAAASRVRYVEIDRGDDRMGDAMVVDTPGLNALDPYHEQVAREFLDEADAVVWVFSATKGGAGSEAEMLHSLRDGGRHVLGILNKVDTLEGGEQEELVEYLREQLGPVLVDVVPLSATKALSHRAAANDGDAEGEDPFAPVDAALEAHFLSRARELKTELTQRRLREALESAGARIREAADALEAMASTEEDPADTARKDVLSLADGLEKGLLDLDEPLMRELLGLGVVVGGKGRTRATDEEDDAYLERTFEDLALERARTVLAEHAATHDPVMATVLDQRLLPWVRGYLAAHREAGEIASIVSARADRAAEGEAALRASLREGLRPLAARWRAHTMTLVPVLSAARRRAHLRRSATPRAEALRLRATTVATVDTLLSRLQPA